MPRPKNIACDLDGTLAVYDGWKGISHIGVPIQNTLDKVKKAIAKGYEVTIFTARLAPGDHPTDYEMAKWFVEEWCVKHVGKVLPVTATKFGWFDEFWDDKGLRLEKNTGSTAYQYDYHSDTIWSELDKE